MKRTILWTITGLASGLIIGFMVGLNHATNYLMPIINELLAL